MRLYTLYICIALQLLLSCALSSVTASDYSVDVPGLQFDEEEQLGAFNLSTAQFYARLSSASNCITHNRRSVTNWSCANCRASNIKLTNITVGETKTAKLGYYVGYSPTVGSIIVVFRGSANLENWIADFSFKLVGYPGCSGCKAHEGFLYSYKEARPAIISAVNGLLSKYPNAAVRITGHSLGGAVAAHCVVDFQASVFKKYEVAGLTFYENTTNDTYNTPIPDEIKALSSTPLSESLSARYRLVLPFYTFGAPRIGCPNFARFFQQRVGGGNFYRLTHRNDFVPRLPLPSQGYAHFSTEVYFPNAGTNTQFRICSGSNGEDPSCVNAAKQNDFGDHGIYAGIVMRHQGSQCS